MNIPMLLDDNRCFQQKQNQMEKQRDYNRSERQMNDSIEIANARRILKIMDANKKIDELENLQNGISNKKPD